MTRLRTAPASTTTPLQFLDLCGLSSPERRAARAEEGAAITAARQAKDRADILRMRENICALVSPERAARMREEWALRDGELGLVEVEEIAPGRIAA